MLPTASASIKSGSSAQIDNADLRAKLEPTALPLGLAHMLRRAPGITELVLEPGDTLLLYTDGITEARSADGELFGPARLSEFVIAELARCSPAETMRRLVHAIVSYESGELRDDATAALVQWHPGGVTPAKG